MSLLKRNGKEKKIKESEIASGSTSNNFLEPPPSPSARLFRKSASIEAGASDGEGGSGGKVGGKRKKFPGFLKKVFGGKENTGGNGAGSLVESPMEEPIKEVVFPGGSAVNGGGNGRGEENGKLGSHESINSVTSSSSFSFVNPSKIGGKHKKGKRIPVDDPDYGKTKVGTGGEVMGESKKEGGNGGASEGGSNGGKKGGLAGTLDRIGMKIGLKMKYNLQSCESLQYIDACEETPPQTSSGIKATSSKKSASPPKSTVGATPDIILGQVEVKTGSTAEPKTSEPPKNGEEPSTAVPSSAPPNNPVRRRSSVKEPKKTVEISVQTPTTVVAVPPPPPAIENEPPTKSETTPVPSTSSAPPAPSTSVAAPSIAPPPKAPSPPKEEPQPSTSAAAYPSTSFSINSNTWSNSGRRKRRAPPPPKYTNGVSPCSPNMVSDTPNDVPSSSSQAALLKKFTRIEESPPPQPRPSCGTFEIRPRKKERSLEPVVPIPSVNRPTSSFASPTPGTSNTLFTRSMNRYHKRSSSEGQSTGGTDSQSNTGTRGRVHKAGKKKAPPPPNPFGDPDVPEDLEQEETPITPPASTQVVHVPVIPPPTTPPKENQAAVPPSSAVPAPNPFEEEETVVTTTEILTTTVEVITTSNNTPLEPPVVRESTPPPSFEGPADELMEEIRQNMLNDQQESQQLGLSSEEPEVTSLPIASPPSPPPEIPAVIPTTVPTASTSTSTGPLRRTVITETDLQSAQHALEVLSASIPPTPSTSASSRTGPATGPAVEPEAKQKLVELKKEAEKSPLNKSKGGRPSSRPISIGSSIYEMLGRQISSSGHQDSSSTGEPSQSCSSSPRIPPKQPWYKNLSPMKLKSTATPIRPFTALVKFSELDKEAAKIVEENRRKSEERRLQETERELMELFAAAGLEETETRREEPAPAPEPPIPSTSVPTAITVEPSTSPSGGDPPPNTILTAAQVHDAPVEEDPSRTQDSSSPTFQSVHAASKHRKVIKPLLTSSPKNNLRSEKLAIVQPQAQQITPPVSTSSVTSQSTSTSTTSPPSTSTVSSSPTSVTSSSPPRPSNRHSGIEWDCPRCTLKNPSWRLLCEICFQRKDPPPPITPSATSYMSSILQRYNAESSAIKTAVQTISSSSPSTPPTTSPPVPSKTPLISSPPPPSPPTVSSIPSVVEEYQAPAPSTPPVPPSTSSDIPSCHNFLPQLPPKPDPLPKKDPKSPGMRLHEDPELEELDISKLRQARLAYFQNKQSSNDSANSEATDSIKSPPSSEHHRLQPSPPISSSDVTPKFADNEDDFIDSVLLQLPKDSSPPPPQKSPIGVPLTSEPLCSRYHPSLEAITEANSQDYSSVCYSAREIAQIYENWQCSNTPQPPQVSSIIPSSFANNNFPTFAHHQPTTPQQRRWYPFSVLTTAPPPTVPVIVPALLADHQPSQNRFFERQNYANVRNVTPPPLLQMPPTLVVAETVGAPPINFNGVNFNNGNMNSFNGRKLSLEELRRMGMGGRGGEWSSESSSSDSSRGVPPASSEVNKLMRRLEAAISQGDHRLAATLAHDMALMKATCVGTKVNQPFSIRVYVEDRCMQQGPFLVQVSSLMSVKDLKGKIQKDWGIPSTFQRWIIGRKMAEEENASLTEFEIGQDSMAFLFLVTPDMMAKGGAPGGASSVKDSSENCYSNMGTLEVNVVPSPEVVGKKKGKSLQVSPGGSARRGGPAKKEQSPPPLPPKSPQPKAIASCSKQGTSQQISQETLNAASALTLSLQQKLVDLKAAAEQTFGKSGGVTGLPPKQQRKENSPAPPVSSKIGGASIRSHEASPSRAKPPVRKGAAGKSSQNSAHSSKEKLSGSKEKLVQVPEKENRFNGILLQTPKADEVVKPPERMDRARKSEERGKKEATPQRSTSSGTGEKVEKVVQTENIVVKKEEAQSPPPPVASPVPANVASETDEETASTSEAAPQPKPRGIKKQATVEKVSTGTEPPTVVVPKAPSPIPSTSTAVPSVSSAAAEVAPIPMPRTVHASKSPPLVKPEDPPPEVPLLKEDPPQLSSPPPQERLEDTPPDYQPPPPPSDVKVDDFCQTTLPFPPPKYKSASTAFGGNLLLRPSAYVSRLTGTPLSSSTSPPTTAIAHVQPVPHLPSPPPPEKTATSSKKDVESPSSSACPVPSSPPAPPPVTSYETMLALMEKQDLILCGEPSECPVCFSDVAAGEGVVLRDCLHIFCRDCLVGCVEHADDSTVKCPYRDNDYSCQNNLQEREIKALVPPPIFEKYLARSVKLAESKIVNTFHCKTPDCSGWCVFEDDVNIFKCPVCSRRNCLTCAAIHEGMDCQKYQREMAIAAETDEDAKQSRLMLEKMIQRGEALDCPACHVVLLKKWGCDWVRCGFCKTGFRWGPGGKGDNSGGCKCGVNGVKCHPKCTYCH